MKKVGFIFCYVCMWIGAITIGWNIGRLIVFIHDKIEYNRYKKKLEKLESNENQQEVKVDELKEA